MNIRNDGYATKDLHFAAFLKAKGMLMRALEQSAGVGNKKTPIYFIFEDRERCLELEHAFWDGLDDDVMVNGKLFSNALRDLRVRMYSINNRIKKEVSSLENV